MDEIMNNNVIEPEYMIPRNCGSITILSDKKLSEDLVKEYEEVLDIKINQDDIIFLEVCQGCGTYNWHIIPIKKTSEIHKTANKVIKLSHTIKDKILQIRENKQFIETFLYTDMKYNKKSEYLEFFPECIKLFTLVGLAIIYKESDEDINFYIGTIMDKIIEKGKEYCRIKNERVWYNGEE